MISATCAAMSEGVSPYPASISASHRIVLTGQSVRTLQRPRSKGSARHRDIPVPRRHRCPLSTASNPAATKRRALSASHALGKRRTGGAWCRARKDFAICTCRALSISASRCWKAILRRKVNSQGALMEVVSISASFCFNARSSSNRLVTSRIIAPIPTAVPNSSLIAIIVNSIEMVVPSLQIAGTERTSPSL